MMGDREGLSNPSDALRHALGLGPGEAFVDDLDDVPAPTHWPSVPALDVAGEWGALASWVAMLQERFAHLDHHVIPRCWWRHNEHVEALVALRDHERASFSAGAPATAGLDWIRALRDVAALLKAWTAETGCAATHEQPAPPLCSTGGAEWERHVEADVRRRAAREVEQAAPDKG